MSLDPISSLPDTFDFDEWHVEACTSGLILQAINFDNEERDSFTVFDVEKLIQRIGPTIGISFRHPDATRRNVILLPPVLERTVQYDPETRALIYHQLARIRSQVIRALQEKNYRVVPTAYSLNDIMRCDITSVFHFLKNHFIEQIEYFSHSDCVISRRIDEIVQENDNVFLAAMKPAHATGLYAVYTALFRLIEKLVRHLDLPDNAKERLDNAKERLTAALALQLNAYMIMCYSFWLNECGMRVRGTFSNTVDRNMFEYLLSQPERIESWRTPQLSIDFLGSALEFKSHLYKTWHPLKGHEDIVVKRSETFLHGSIERNIRAPRDNPYLSDECLFISGHGAKNPISLATRQNLIDFRAVIGLLGKRDKMRLVIDAMKGCMSLHELGVSHNDIGPHNIGLWFDNVGQFHGRLFDIESATTFGSTERVPFLDVIRGGQYIKETPEILNAASDVFSFGISLALALDFVDELELWRMLLKPDPHQALLDVLNRAQLTQPPHAHTLPLVVSMLDRDPTRRPPLAACIETLGKNAICHIPR